MRESVCGRDREEKREEREGCVREGEMGRKDRKREVVGERSMGKDESKPTNMLNG